MPTVVVSFLSAIPIITTLVSTTCPNVFEMLATCHKQIINGGFSRVEVLPSPFNCSDIVRLSSQWIFK